MYPQQQPLYNHYPNYQPYPPQMFNHQQNQYPQYQQPPNYNQQNLNPPNPPHELTLRQMMETDVTHTPLGIVYPANQRGIELKSSFIHQLTKFHGLDRKDPQNHLKSFHMICLSMLPEHVALDDFKLTAFPLTLEDKARESLFNLPPGSIHTWEELLKAFNSKFYPTSQISSQRSDILGIRQGDNETFHDFWERFNNLCTKIMRV